MYLRKGGHLQTSQTSRSWLIRGCCIIVALAAAFLSPGPARAQAYYPSEHTLDGVTVYDSDWLAAFAYQHVSGVDGVVTPQRYAEALELIYREDGYFLAEVEILQAPGGQFVFRMHEGSIGQVSIEGVDDKLYRRIRSYVEPIVGRAALNKKEFERAIALANDLAGVSITTEIDYPDPEGGARLQLLGQTVRQSGRAAIDNPPRQFAKSVTGAVTQEFYNTLVAGDLLRLQGEITYSGPVVGSGVTVGGTAYYRAPIGPSGLYFEGYAGNVYARRDASGTLVNTQLRGLNTGVVLGYPWLRDLHQYGYALVEARHSRVNSTGGGFNYTSGVNALGGMLLYGYNMSNGAPIRAGVNLTVGERVGTSGGIDDGDAHFWHVRAGFGTSQPLDALVHNLAYRFEIFGQYTTSRLPHAEEFYLGDRTLLRGYSFAEASGDIGVTGTFEIDYTIEPESELVSRVTPYAFIDFGRIVNNAPAIFEERSRTLASTGVGLTAVFANDFSLNTYVGVPLLAGARTPRHSAAIYMGLTKSW